MSKVRMAILAALAAVAIAVAGTFAFGVGGDVASAGGEKVDICHHTGSEKNPHVLISVSENAVPAHRAHGDHAPNDDGTCEHRPTP